MSADQPHDQLDLEELHEQLVKDALEKEQDSMKLDNRSIFTLREEMVKKAKADKHDAENK